MSIVDHAGDWGLSERGIRDAARHREKIDEQIRKNVKDVIGEESIITNRGGKKVRIPVKGLKDFRFRHGINDDAQRGGVGQGKGKPGDVIARREGDGDSDGQKAGNEKGEEYMEVEVDIDYLIKIMFEDLGLPYIEQKTKADILIPSGWKFESISKVGIQPRIHKKRTLLESLKRTAAYVQEIIETTKCTQENAERALSQSQGNLEEAILIIKENRVDMAVNPDDLYLEDEDFRFRKIEQEYEVHSNAVIICMMDISGSMSPEKKYLAKSYIFWLNEFLKKTYNNVQIRFIVHTTDARIVNEKEFFTKGEWGGTRCHTAFDMATNLLEVEYPIEMWNRYVVYCSDGEDFDMGVTMNSTRTMIKKGLNMLTYLQITPTSENGGLYGEGELLKQYRKDFNMIAYTCDGRTYFKNEQDHFLACEIKGKEDIYPALKSFLFKKKEEKN